MKINEAFKTDWRKASIEEKIDIAKMYGIGLALVLIPLLIGAVSCSRGGIE